jgi:hypothetical protein
VELKQRLDAAIRKVAEVQVAAKAAVKPAAPSGDADETERLRSDNASMKKKLAAAETALEQAAALKARMARLEAQLKK